MAMKKYIGYALFILFVLALILWPLLLHATTTAKHDNSIGVVQYTTNPNLYIVGAVSEILSIDNDKGIVVRIQPAGTYALFTEDLLLCGYPVDKFVGKANPVVLTYEVQAHKMIEGIGCHRLINVQEIKLPKGFK
jgi:hypothetical protein